MERIPGGLRRLDSKKQLVGWVEWSKSQHRLTMMICIIPHLDVAVDDLLRVNVLQGEAQLCEPRFNLVGRHNGAGLLLRGEKRGEFSDEVCVEEGRGKIVGSYIVLDDVAQITTVDELHLHVQQVVLFVAGVRERERSV